MLPLVVGGLNWGAIGLFNLDLVQLVFGGETTYRASTMSRIIYSLVGVSALYALTVYTAAELEDQSRMSWPEDVLSRKRERIPAL
jgi:hypothetical protein